MNPTRDGKPVSGPSGVIESIAKLDLKPRGLPYRVEPAQPVATINRGTSYYGEDNSASKPAGSGSADPLTTGSLTEGVQSAPGDGYELNFENTPVATVAKAILGDIL